MFRVRIIPTRTEPVSADTVTDDVGFASASVYWESSWELLGPFPGPSSEEGVEFSAPGDNGEDPRILIVDDESSRVFHIRTGVTGETLPEAIDIHLDAYHAFGDGKHPTTEMCIDFLGKHLSQIMEGEREALSMIDVGTGSGILSILAIKCGIGRVDAIDLSPEAVRCAEANVRLNGCDVRVQRCDVSLFDPGTGYDVVAANLVTEVFVRNMPALSRLMKKGGTMIASGISAGSAETAVACFRNHGFEVRDSVCWKGWMGFVLRRDDPRPAC